SLLDSPAFPVALIEPAGNRPGGGEVRRHQEMQGFLGGFETPGSVQARRELESDLIRARRSVDGSDLLQSHQARPSRNVQLLKAGGNQDAIFPGQGHEVGDSSERDEVEELSDVEIRGGGDTQFAPALDEGVGELESESNGAQLPA